MMEFIDIDALVECYKQDPQMTDDKWVQWAQACAARVAHLDSHHSNEAAGYAAAGATSWKVQYQATSMVGAGQVPASTGGIEPAYGNLGYYTEQARLRASAVSATSTIAGNVTATALTLSPGRYELNAWVGFVGTASSITARSATISEVSATAGSNDNSRSATFCTGNLNTFDETMVLPTYKISITVTTTYYLVANATFTGGTCGFFGRIQARQI